MRRKNFVVLLLALLSTLLSDIDCGCAHAGDEVDYSAPYITVENGELVTRYPAREHISEDRDPRLLAGLLVAMAVIAIVAAVRRRRNQPNKKYL